MSLPVDRTFEGVLRQHRQRIELLERRLKGRGTGGGSDDGSGIPRLRVVRTDASTIAVNAVISYQQVDADTESGWNAAASQYTVQADGLYDIFFAAKQSGTASYYVDLQRNGVMLQRTPNTWTSGYGGLWIARTALLKQGDVIRVMNGGTAWTPQIDAPGTHNFLEIVRSGGARGPRGVQGIRGIPGPIGPAGSEGAGTGTSLQLAQLERDYIGPGPARVMAIGGGALSEPLDWVGKHEPQGNRIVRLDNYNGQSVIAGHADGYSIGGWRRIEIELPGVSVYNEASGGWWDPLDGAVRAVRTPAGIVAITGLLRTVATVAQDQTWFTLPEDMRPDTQMIFPSNINGSAGSIFVFPDGQVRVGNSVPAGWVSFDNVCFPASGVAEWTPLTSFLNGWSQHPDALYGTARYWVDPDGVAWLAGLVSSGTTTEGTPMLQLPTSFNLQRQSHQLAVANRVFGGVRATLPSQTLSIGAGAAGWMSLCGVTLLTDQAWSGLNWWSPIDFMNGFFQNAANEVFGITKRADGLVLARGLMQYGTNGAAITYPPERFLSRGQTLRGAVSSWAFARLDVLPVIQGATPKGLIPQNGSGWYSLDGQKWYPAPL